MLVQFPSRSETGQVTVQWESPVGLHSICQGEKTWRFLNLRTIKLVLFRGLSVYIPAATAFLPQPLQTLFLSWKAKIALFPGNWDQWPPVLKTNSQDSSGQGLSWVHKHSLSGHRFSKNCYPACADSPVYSVTKQSEVEQHGGPYTRTNSKRLVSFRSSCCQIFAIQFWWPGCVLDVTVVTCIHIR